MNILIAGASGMIGRALFQALSLEPNALTLVGRSKKTLERCFGRRASLLTWEELEAQPAKPYDWVINLCGANISAKRWTKAYKQQLIDSRVQSNQRLIHWLKQDGARPHFISANAVGIYGIQAEADPKPLDEDSPLPQGQDFLNQIGLAWQDSLQEAITAGITVTIPRFGVVLQAQEGMLKALEPGFRLGLGAKLGQGQQVISWIHIEDLVQALLFLLSKPEITGAINLCAPQPVQQLEFANCLADVLKRPRWLKLPASLVRLLFGEMGDCLLLGGQKVVPTRLLKLGFQFRYPQLQAALEREYAR